ncbi:MAG: histidine phosphatase family protein, partial [Negativicoccus succinicivorans]|nr:histidine phosphatase family protein [Negativicoccus succinicivorans]
MLRLLLARHGETKWNLEGRYQGQVDTELSELGQTQGEKLGESLRAVPIDAVLASPLRRARETAEYCAKWHGLPVVADADLTEIAHGAWEGKLVAEVAHADGDRLTA